MKHIRNLKGGCHSNWVFIYNDGVPTSVELQYHLDIFNSADAEADLDNDGLSNIFEYEHNLSITDKDTDHDGINDGEELKYWNETRKLDLDTSLSYCRIPDVDNDSIPDGKEINGYEVKIITGWKDDGTPKSEMRTIKSDPLLAYRDSNGNWVDSDWDNIPDVVESNLANSTTFLKFYNFTHSNDEYLSLWNDYSWAIAYYFSIKLHKKWDVIYTAINGNDGVSSLISYNSETEHNKSCLENATNYLTSQFNPFVKEREPPMMMKFNLQAENGKLYYHILLRDAGKIANVLINDVTGSEFYVNSDVDSVVFEHSGYFNLSVSEQIFKVDIEVVSYDSNGWKLDVEKEVNGPLGEWVDIVTQYFSALFKLFVEIGKIVAKGVSFLLDWIISFVKDMINKFIETMMNLVRTFVEEVYEVFKVAFKELLDALGSRNGGTSTRDLAYRSTVTFLTNSIIQRIFYAIFGVAITIQIIEYSVMVSSNAVPGLSLILSAVLSGVICGLLLGVTSAMIQHFTKPNDLFKDNETFWAGGLGLAIQGVYTAIKSALKAGTWGDVDVRGVFLAFISLVISLGSARVAGIGLWFINWLSFIIAVVGLGSALLPSPTDNPANPLWWIEEVIAAISVTYTAGILIYDSDGDGIPNGLDTTP